MVLARVLLKYAITKIWDSGDFTENWGLDRPTKTGSI